MAAAASLQNDLRFTICRRRWSTSDSCEGSDGAWVFPPSNQQTRGSGQCRIKTWRGLCYGSGRSVKSYSGRSYKRRIRFRIDTEVRCVGAQSHPPFWPYSRSRRGLNPIKTVYDPDRPDGRLNLTASVFNQLGQYTSSPGRTGHCYAELAVFFPSSGRNHRQYSLRAFAPAHGGMARLSWPGWLVT